MDGPNLYQYGLNSPLNYSDPLGLYNSVFHKGLTTYLAGLAGFSRNEAGLLGTFANRPDEDERGPLFTTCVVWPDDRWFRGGCTVAGAFGLRFSPQKRYQGAKDLRDWHFPETIVQGCQ